MTASPLEKSAKMLTVRLKRMNPRLLDAAFHKAHQEAFSCIDCLQCANCCTTTGPLLTDKDIQRVAKHLRLKDVDFVSQYVRIDEDNDQVFKSMPCPFLGSDNYCSIYDHRPKACREYPHTDRVKQHQLLNLHVKNVRICPAVEHVLKTIGNEL